MKITANGIAVNYTLDGPEGAPVVTMSHSLSANLSMWAPQLAALGDDYRLLRYDTRGHGASDAPPGPYSIGMLADDAVALLDALGIARTHFVGLSLGGMIGQRLGRTAGDRLLSLTLCATTSRMPAAMQDAWQQRIATAEGSGMAALAEPTIERWFTAPCRAERPELAAPVRRMIEATPVAGYVGCSRAIMALDETDRLGEIACPTLVICGADDPSTPPAAAREIHARIPGAKLAIIDRAAHFVNWEQADAFNEALAGFLAEAPKA